MKLFISLHHITTTALTALLLLGSCTTRQSDVTTHTSRSALTYEGQIVNGQREGLGVLYQADSIIYEGHWHKGLRHGKGWTRDSLGRKITG